MTAMWMDNMTTHQHVCFTSGLSYFYQWEPLIFNPPPTNSTSLNRSSKIVTRDYVGDSYPKPNLVQIRLRGEGFWANAWNITHFLFIYTLFLGTHPQVRPVGRSSRWMAQTTRIREGCDFGVSLILLPIKGVKFPQNPDSPKRAKNSNFHIFKTTA